MNPEVIFFGEWLVAVGAVVLSLSNVDHLSVLVEVALLREPHIALRALEGLLLCVRS